MKKVKKELILSLSAIVITLTLLISTSYAAFIWSDESDEQKLKASYGDVSIVELSNGEPINLENAFPMSEEEGKSLTPYSFKIHNYSNFDQLVALKIVPDYELINELGASDNLINPKYINVQISGYPFTTIITTLDKLNNGILYENIKLFINRYESFNLRIWLNEDTPNSEIGKEFHAKLELDTKQIDKLSPNKTELVINNSNDTNIKV